MTRARTLFGCSILGLVLLLAQPVRGFQNEPNNCRGIKWGTKCDALQGLTKISSKSSLDYYKKEGEEMTFGDARLDMVVYVFYEKELCGVVLNFKSSPDFQIIKTALFDRYGKGRQPNRYKDQYRWAGTKVTITLEYDDITQKGQVIYYYMPIYAKKQKLDQRRMR